MYASEARSLSSESGCASHGLADCLCDVPLLPPVKISSVPFAERLLQLGVDRLSFVAWAEEVAARIDTQRDLRLVAEA